MRAEATKIIQFLVSPRTQILSFLSENLIFKEVGAFFGVMCFGDIFWYLQTLLE